jgi:hypothetical protein
MPAGIADTTIPAPIEERIYSSVTPCWAAGQAWRTSTRWRTWNRAPYFRPPLGQGASVACKSWCAYADIANGQQADA